MAGWGQCGPGGQMSLLLRSFLEPVNLTNGLSFSACFLVCHLRILSLTSWGLCERAVGSGWALFAPFLFLSQGSAFTQPTLPCQPSALNLDSFIQLTLSEHLCTYLFNKFWRNNNDEHSLSRREVNVVYSFNKYSLSTLVVPDPGKGWYTVGA